MPRRFATLIVVVTAACGGKPAPAPARAGSPAEPPPTPAAEPAERADAPAPTPTPRQAAVLARLHDDGPVPGVPGLVQQRTRSARHCGGERVALTFGAAKLSPDEEAIAAMYRLEFPRDLDFSPNPEHQARREASMKKFKDWLQNAMKVGAEGTRMFEGKLKSATSPEEKAAAAARIGQISNRVASILARAEIPTDVRTGELAADKIEAFCDEMINVAEPLVMRAGEAFKACGGVAAPQAWFAPLCPAP